MLSLIWLLLIAILYCIMFLFLHFIKKLYIWRKRKKPAKPIESCSLSKATSNSKKKTIQASKVGYL